MGCSISESQLAQLRHELVASTLLVCGDDGFDEKLERWSKAAIRPAGAILLAQSVSDVATVVAFCNKHSIDMAVRGGGHSTSGASSSDGGIVVDLSLMREVRVSADEKLICAQGGCVWGDVDDAAAEHSLACVGGTVRHTGVGGLTLGGGYGWLSGLHGLTIDNLASAKIVVANGTVLDVSATENADLFWAIRGAGHNFGVIVEFVFRAVECKDFWGGIMVFPSSAIPGIVEFWNHLIPRARGRATGGICFARPNATGDVVVIVPVLFFGPEAEALQVFEPLMKLSPLHSTACLQPWPAANKLLPAPYGFRTSMKGGLFRLPLGTDFVQDMYKEYADFTTEYPEAHNTVMAFEMLNSETVCKKEASATAFNNRHNHCNVQVIPFWKNESLDEVCRQWARTTTKRIEDEFSKTLDGPSETVAVPAQASAYGNYSHSTEGAQKHFGSNYERLQSLKKHYDPENTFNKLFPITFAE